MFWKNKDKLIKFKFELINKVDGVGWYSRIDTYQWSGVAKNYKDAIKLAKKYCAFTEVYLISSIEVKQKDKLTESSSRHQQNDNEKESNNGTTQK